MNDQRRLVGSIAAIIGLIVFVVYGHHSIKEITGIFVDGRQSVDGFFAELVRSNWDGITTISDKEKQTLLENLRPELAGADVKTMGSIATILVYAFGLGLIVDRFIAIGRILLTRKRYDRAMRPTCEDARG